jgi:hypothetical protein
VGSILQTFGMMMTSVSTQYYQILLAQGVCTSIGMSAIYVPGKKEAISPKLILPKYIKC